MQKQMIYSRYEYSKDFGKTYREIVDEYNDMFESKYNEQGVIISGVSATHNMNDDTIILLVYSLEAEVFLKLKFMGRKDVKISRYITIEEKYG